MAKSWDYNYEKKTTNFSLLLLKVPEVVRAAVLLILRAYLSKKSSGN